METGRKRAIWKNMEGAGLLEMGIEKGVRGRKWKGG